MANRTLKEALEAYEEVLQSEDGEELKAEMKQECHYVIEPNLPILVLQMRQEIIPLTESSYKSF